MALSFWLVTAALVQWRTADACHLGPVEFTALCDRRALAQRQAGGVQAAHNRDRRSDTSCMSFSEWFPAISTSSMLALALWLGRTLIKERLTRSVEFEFGQKIEEIRTDLRASEERFKSQLRVKEAEVAALRAGALTGIVNRQSAQEKRRLEAVDQLWAAVHSLAQNKGAAATIAALNFETALQAAAQSPKASEIFSIFADGEPKGDHSALGGAVIARPHLTDLAWALYSAYQAIIVLSTLQIQMLKRGLNMPEVLDKKRAADVIKVALPDYSAYIDKHGTGAAYHLLDILEMRLLDELRRILKGEDADDVAVALSAEILKKTQSLANDMEVEKALSIVEAIKKEN